SYSQWLRPSGELHVVQNLDTLPRSLLLLIVIGKAAESWDGLVIRTSRTSGPGVYWMIDQMIRRAVEEIVEKQRPCFITIEIQAREQGHSSAGWLFMTPQLI
ncbi:hypothetical protein AFLA70_339g001071, partial [Aspergillus flavus AF70]